MDESKQIELTDQQILNFVNNGLIPFWKREDYFKKVSNKKLIDAAIRVLYPHIRLYTAQEAIFDEMIRRLEKKIGLSEVVEKIIKENNKKM